MPDHSGASVFRITTLFSKFHLSVKAPSTLMLGIPLCVGLRTFYVSFGFFIYCTISFDS
jgi:hypothetical protein